MALAPAPGSVIQSYREHVTANPGQTATITAGGTQGANTATLSSVTGVYGGMVMVLTGGTSESITVLSVSGSVVTFVTNIANTSHTGATWGYAAPICADYRTTAEIPDSPYNTTLTLCPAYLTQQPDRSWQHQLRVRQVQT